MKNDFSWKKDFVSIGCDFLVWDEGFNLKGNIFDVTTKTKRGNCFFWKFIPGMLQPAARELQKRDSENKKLKKSLSYTRAGLYIAAGALLIEAILKLYLYFYS